MLSRAPPPIALLRFPNVREKEKGLKSLFHGPTYDASFSIHRHYFATINESGIVVLLRQFWVSAGKEKATMQRVFLSAPTSLRNSQR